jgi:hypothetical protein
VKPSELARKAADELLAVDGARLFKTADTQGVPFFPADRTDDHVSVRKRYKTAHALRAALESGDPVALRSAPYLLVAVDPVAAWPIVRGLVSAKPEKGFQVAVSGARDVLLYRIPCVDDDTLFALLEDEDLNVEALSESVVNHRPQVAARLALLEAALSRPQTDGSWRLAEDILDALAEEGNEVPRDLPAVLRRAAGGADAQWATFARRKLAAFGDESTLRAQMSGLDAENPQPAINAAIALGPDAAMALVDRFFGDDVLRTPEGNRRARSILHSIMTRVMIHEDKRWDDPRYRALVARCSADKGSDLGFSAINLGRVLDGKEPRVQSSPRTKPASAGLGPRRR